MQQTLKRKAEISGVGLHSGADISMTLCPADIDTGIIFARTDLPNHNEIPALWNNVVDTRLCTVIANKEGASVGTVEHLMAALRGCGIDNLRIEIDGPEVPVMDGSSMPFVNLIEDAGTETQARPKKAIKILREVTVEKDGKTVVLRPAEGSVFGGRIDFKHPEIGNQKFETKLLNGNFKHDLAEARTFGFLSEVEMLQKNGLALGGSLENAIVLDNEVVLNPDGLRWDDEFVRHKLLDAVGDLYLAGAPIIGAYEGIKAGHEMNNELLKALFAQPGAWEFVELDEKYGSVDNISFVPVSRQEDMVPA